MPYWVGYILLFLMLVFPMALSLLYIKALLFAILLCCVIFSLISAKRQLLDPYLLNWAIFYIVIAVSFSLIGVINNAPGAIKQLQIYGLWPLIYLMLCTGLTDYKILRGVHLTIIVSGITISIYSIVIFLISLGWISDYYKFFEFLSNQDETRVGLNYGNIGMSFAGINSLPYIGPYIMTAFYSNPARQIISQKILALSLMLVLISGFISGRRGVYVVYIIAPVIYLILNIFCSDKNLKSKIFELLRMLLSGAFVLWIIFALVNYFYEIDPFVYWDDLVNGFDFSDANFDPSTLERSYQSIYLLDGWASAPFFGNGFGAVASYVRNDEMPWAYEMYYLSLLFQIGVFGIFSYAIGIFYIYRAGIKIINSNASYAQLVRPALVGLACYLIASSSNPYLVRFDGLWAIFIPLAIINSVYYKNMGDCRAKC